MKVGVITFHSSHNYGSMLQTYALQSILEQFGVDVDIIDYRHSGNENRDRLFRPNRYRHKLSCLVADIIRFPRKYKRFQAFWNFAKKYYNLTKNTYYSDHELEKDLDDSYAAFICGSDQIWNPSCTAEVVPAYFLEFAKNRDILKIAYAPSIGHSDIQEKYVSDFKKFIKNIDFISVREKTSVNVVSKLTEKPVKQVLDPTLLLSSKNWDKIAIEPNLKGKYIALYMLENNKELPSYAKVLSENMGLKIVTFSKKKIFDFSNSISCHSAGPCEFLGIIKNAEYVITNSFHATIFSILFKKQVAVFLTKYSGARISDLLELLGLSERIVYNRETFKITKGISYEDAYKTLEKEIKNSKEYLFNALNANKT